MAPDPTLVDRLARHGQGHLLRWWDELDQAGRARLTAEVEGIDLDQLDTLIEGLVRKQVSTVPEAERVRPIDVFRLPRTDAERVERRHVAEAGAGPEHVVRMTWYVTDMQAYLAGLRAIGEVYRAAMGPVYPAMALVQVVGLVDPDALIEIETTAVVPD